MQPNDLPLVCLPIGLSDQAAAQVLEFLHAFTEAFEQHYAGELLRYYSAIDQRNANDRRTNRRQNPPKPRRPAGEPGTGITNYWG